MHRWEHYVQANYTSSEDDGEEEECDMHREQKKAKRERKAQEIRAMNSFIAKEA